MHKLRRVYLSLAAVVIAASATMTPANAACTQRIVTLGSNVTETVYALGAGDCIVAADTTSDYPGAAQQLPKVGYLRALNAEGVLALEPDLILGNTDAGPPQVIEQLQRAGVRVELVSAPDNATGALATIKGVAAVLGRPEAGARLHQKVRREVCIIKAQIATIERRKTVLFLLTIAGGSPLAAGRDTAAASIIRLAGGINAVQAFTGYKPLNPEALSQLAPDVIVLMAQGLEAYGGKRGILALPGVSLTPAGQYQHIVAMAGTLLLGFGPRVGEAASTLANKLYPNRTKANVPRCR